MFIYWGREDLLQINDFAFCVCPFAKTHTNERKKERKKKNIDRKFPSWIEYINVCNTVIIQIYALLAYKEYYNLKSVVAPISLRGASSGST